MIELSKKSMNVNLSVVTTCKKKTKGSSYLLGKDKSQMTDFR